MNPKTIVFVTGLSGVGKSTVSKKLGRVMGFAFFSVGGFQRAWVREQGYSDAAMFNRAAGLEKAYFSILPRILEKIKELARKHEGVIVEGLYTSSLMKDIQKAFPRAQIHLFNLRLSRHERVKRYAATKKITLTEAKENMRRLDRQKRKIGLIQVQQLRGGRIHVISNRSSLSETLSQMRKVLPHHR